jgi:hypothetical protein
VVGARFDVRDEARRTVWVRSGEALSRHPFVGVGGRRKRRCAFRGRQ